MRFYGNGAVWNKETNSVLCKFKNGEFATVDAYIASRLSTLGYKSDGVAVIEKVPKSTEKTPIGRYAGTSAKTAQGKKAVRK